MSSNKKEVIVLVNPPNEKIVLRDMYSSTMSKGSYNWPCVDLLVLSGILKNTFDVKLIDANTLGLSVSEAVDLVCGFKPKGAVLSFAVSVKQEDFYFAAKIKERLPQIKIVGTGGFLYHNYQQELMAHRELDACLLNYTTNDIEKYFSNDFSDLNNVIHKLNGEIISTPKKYPGNGFSYPTPLHEQLPISRYRLSHGKQKPITSVLTGYGCVAKCTYCVSEKINFRYRAPCNVLEELDYLKTLGVKEIFFRDTVFCAHKKQGYEIMEGMIRNNYSFSWVADTRADVLTEETVEVMKKSGCHALHIGVESANPDILKKYSKGITLTQVERAFNLCKKFDIKTVGYFILGLPGESVEDVEQTINLAISLDCDYASFNIPVPILGTSLREEAKQKGWVMIDEDRQYDGSLAPIMETGKISADEILQLKEKAFKKFYFRPKYIVKTITRPRNVYQARMIVSETFNLFAKFFLKVR